MYNGYMKNGELQITFRNLIALLSRLSQIDQSVVCVHIDGHPGKEHQHASDESGSEYKVVDKLCMQGYNCVFGVVFSSYIVLFLRFS